MRAGTRLVTIIGASAFDSFGYGVALPFLYVDIARARGLGATSAALALISLAVGALLGTAVAARTTDRYSPKLVATAGRLAAGLGMLALGYAADAPAVWAAAAAYGAADAMALPAVQLMLLAGVRPTRGRDVFAWEFVAMNLALAAGGLVGGALVDLSGRGGHRIYLVAAAASVTSAAALLAVGGDRRREHSTVEAPRTSPARVIAVPAVRRLLGITALMTLAYYAQFSSGMPAFALTSLHASAGLLSIGIATNAALVAALTGPVIALTRRCRASRLLAAAAALWLLGWAAFAVPLVTPAATGPALIAGYALLSLGETVYSPVLAPYAATVAPTGQTGATLATVNGTATLVTALGPALAAAALSWSGGGFVTMQIAFCLAAWRVAASSRRHRARRPAEPLAAR
jgi:MFS family permease